MGCDSKISVAVGGNTLSLSGSFFKARSKPRKSYRKLFMRSRQNPKNRLERRFLRRAAPRLHLQWKRSSSHEAVQTRGVLPCVVHPVVFGWADRFARSQGRYSEIARWPHVHG